MKWAIQGHVTAEGAAEDRAPHRRQRRRALPSHSNRTSENVGVPLGPYAGPKGGGGVLMSLVPL